MIRRLSLSAFAITLVFLLSVYGICASSSVQRVNQVLEDEIQSICRLSAERLDSAAFQSDEARAFMADSAFTTGTVFHVFAPDGSVEYASRLQADPMTEAELKAVLSGESTSLVRKHNTYMSPWAYAFTVLDNGNVLRVSRSAETVSSLWGAKAFLMPALAVAIAGAVWVAVLYCYQRIRLPMKRMTEVLEDFTEGNFDSRIPQDVAISAEDTAHFNEVMGRLQDRVFRQSTRNHALSAVMNSMQTGMLAVDNEMRILIVTPTAKRLLGITGSPENMPISQASHDVDLVPMFQEAMAQEGVYTNSVAARTGVGRGKRPLRLYVSPMRQDGKLEGAVAMIEDVTELRRLEQVRNDFVANVSHELKTPLTSIKGFVETLQAGAINKPEMAQRFLKIINLETDRLTRLINDILSISKLESGDENLPKERMELRHAASDICEMLRLHASQKDVTINMNAGNEACYVLGNPDRIRQMLINLIENAIKYNKDGGQVHVSVYASGDTVNFTCADTGIGIPEEHIPRLFERFYRVDKGRSRKMGGTGLGLAIVKHIVNSLGGMIEVQSKFGEGTEFLVTLPRVEADTQEETSVNDDPFDFEDAIANR
ncbi:MAG: PAS domain S-box protein [Clostridia bacterium]|nr:PAS domain S-box protein [Clostridia bacterium]